MQGFVQWWGNAVRTFLAFLGDVFSRLKDGLMHEWDIRLFIFAMFLILILGLTSVFRKKF